MATSGKNLICHSSLNDNCTASLFFNDGDPDAEEALSVDCCTSLDDLNRKNTMIPILAYTVTTSQLASFVSVSITDNTRTDKQT